MRALLSLLVATLLGSLLGLVLTATSPASPAGAAVPVPPTPTGLPRAIEPLAYYVPQTSCSPAARAGTLKLVSLITHTYPGIYAGTGYACGTDGTVSEHYDGRAIDWMASIRVPSQYAKAKALLAWFLATDSQGNTFARARRLGVQYLIYNNRIWSTYNGKWNPYQDCAKTPSTARDSYCHRNHVHISLSWNGARGASSWWTKRVPAFDFGPCRQRDLNWAGNWTGVNTRSCTYYPRISAPAGASTVKRNLVPWSGISMVPGLTGPAVRAVQAALRVPQTGVYDLATLTAVSRFRVRHGLPAGPTMGLRTWRALLAATR